MSPRDRFIKAVYLEEPDRIPLFEIEINRPIIRKILGREPKSIFDYYDAYVLFGLDGINFWEEPTHIEYLDTNSFIDEWRRVWETQEEIMYYKEGLIKNLEELHNFSPPDPFDYNKLEKIKKIVKNNRKGLAIVGGIQDAYEIPSQMVGVENFLINMYSNPKFVTEVVEMSTRYNIERAKSLIDLGVDAILSGDDYAYKNGPFMKPDQFKEFIYPYLQQIIGSVHKRGVPFIKHTDGYLWPILDDIINAGIDALHPIEPMARMDLNEVKENYRDKICIIGNVDVAHTLPFGSRQEVINEVKSCIDKAASGGGYIMSSSNSIHNAVKIENFKLMIKTTERYGKYTIKKVGR